MMLKPIGSRPKRRAAAALLLASTLAAAGAGVGCGGSAGAGPGFEQTDLVSNVSGAAAFTDPDLVKTWGIARSASGTWMVANNATGTSTAYDGNGAPAPSGSGTLVTIPPSSTSPVGSVGSPTGIVFNPSTGFVIANGTAAAPAQFVFATFDGTLAAWNPAVSPNSAITMIDNSAADALYTGLAIGSNPTGGPFLYAADLRGGAVDVFDQNWNPVAIAGGFVDPHLPASYVPFGIHNIGGDIYVAYAKENRQQDGPIAGAGLGFVSVFDTEGNFIKRFTSQGQLNAPWGVILAPASFGRFGNATIIGNSGDGRLNAFDPVSGRFLGQVQKPNAHAIVINGVFGIGFGNGASAGSVDTLYFGAGPGDGSEGLFGAIDPQD